MLEKFAIIRKHIFIFYYFIFILLFYYFIFLLFYFIIFIYFFIFCFLFFVFLFLFFNFYYFRYLIRGTEDNIRKQSENNDELYNLIHASSKMIFLDKLLKKLRSENKKVLIFSQMTHMLDILEDYMYFSDFSYVRLDGSTKKEERQNSIDSFFDTKKDLFVFLLSTKAGGLGINLQIADNVVIFDSDW